MDLIATIDKGLGISYKGKLIADILEARAYTYQITAGQAILYSRKAQAAFPGGEPIGGRINYVLTRSKYSNIGTGSDVVRCRSYKEAARNILCSGGREVYVLGGGITFDRFMDLCTYAYITEIDTFCPADRLFPKRILTWEEVYAGPWKTCPETGLTWRARTLKNPHVEGWQDRLRRMAGV